jgi:hypothetical protein
MPQRRFPRGASRWPPPLSRCCRPHSCLIDGEAIAKDRRLAGPVPADEVEHRKAVMVGDAFDLLERALVRLTSVSG